MLRVVAIYNGEVLRAKRLFLIVAVCLFVAASAWAQASGSRSVLVLPFDNLSHQPGLAWIGEAFPEVLGQRLKNSFYVINRDDRQYAFDRMGIPVNLHASRATLYRIAAELDADYIVLGGYSYDGDRFTAKAELLDMKELKLSDAIVESGELDNLIGIQTALAWDVLQKIDPSASGSREQFVHAAPAIRLTAFENFIRGVVSLASADRIRYLKAALAIDGSYSQATMLLAKTYYAGRDWTQAAQWFAKVPDNDELTGEANFYLGLTEYQLGHFDRAATAFEKTAERVPLTEVINNAGVAESRRGHRSALEYFQKAVAADPADADYHFNYALTLYRRGEVVAAQRQLREALARNPNDSEARQLLEAINAGAIAAALPTTPGAPAAVPHPVNLPLPRLKRNYDESSYRQLALQLQNAIDASIRKAKPSQQVEMHMERAREFLAKGATDEAANQFREALKNDPRSAAASAGLAHALLLSGKANEARQQAQASLLLEPTAEAYVVLARLDMKEHLSSSARGNLQKAQALDPSDADVQALEKELGPEP